MRQFIIAMLMFLAVTAYAGINVIDEVTAKNDAFEVVVDMHAVGDYDTDSTLDMDDDGIIDARRLVNTIHADFDGYFVKYSNTGDSLGLAVPSGLGMPASDFNDSLESQVHFSPKLWLKMDSTTAVRGAINDSLQANWATFIAGSATVKWRDSSYIYLDTANILGGNTEIKAWLDTTAVRVPIADSTHGGATRATTSAVADSANGGSIRSETCKIADSCDGGAARAEVSDSTNSPFRAAAHDTLYANTPGYLTSETGDIEGVTAGTGLSGGGTTGTVTLNHAAHTGDVTGTTELTITAQTIKPDDIDSTGEDFVFAQIYKGMSSNSDSQLVTIETIEDSLAKIWSRVEYYIVNARFVHGRADKPNDAVILSLEAYDEDTCDTYLYRDSSTAADQTDTAYINFGNLPYGVTKCDSLILKYRSSSATTTTSCIANIRLYLDGVPQWEHTTDEASVADERLALYPNDADFDAGELAVVQIIFVGDANAWIKVVSAYLFCSG
jgi:hypothetical protein